MYTRWLRIYEDFLKNNLNSSDEDIKKGLFDKFRFDVTMEAVKKKRQRINLIKTPGRKKTTIEKNNKQSLNGDI